MVKTVWHWKNICKYLILGFFVVSGWVIIIRIFMSIFNPPFLISSIIALIGGLLVGAKFSSIFSKKYSLYYFE